MSNVIVKNTKKYGRGLYANRKFKKGEIIEVSPVVVIDKYDTPTIGTTFLNLYIFYWTKICSAIALGYGSLFNHSKKSNVNYYPNFVTKEMIFKATKNIERGQQLFIDYGYDPNEEKKNTEEYRNYDVEMLKYRLGKEWSL